MAIENTSSGEMTVCEACGFPSRMWQPPVLASLSLTHTLSSKGGLAICYTCCMGEIKVNVVMKLTAESGNNWNVRDGERRLILGDQEGLWRNQAVKGSRAISRSEREAWSYKSTVWVVSSSLSITHFFFRLTSTTRPELPSRRSLLNPPPPVSTWHRAQSMPSWRKTAIHASSNQTSTWAWPGEKPQVLWQGGGPGLLFSTNEASLHLAQTQGYSDSTCILDVEYVNTMNYLF